MPTDILNWDGDELHCFSNVTNYTWTESKQYGWHITYESKHTQPQTDRPLYFILDSMNHAAFCHWVYENALWLPVFQKLRQHYPSCKLVVEDRKQYKELYLDFYGIPLDCVCLHEEILPKNYCFFHSYTSLNDPSVPSIFYQHLREYQTLLYSLQTEKSIPLLYLPRGIKENLQGPNNRSYNIQPQLKDLVRNLGGTVYETDKTTSLLEQIRIVKSAKILIVDYGSNLWVNGLFAQSSKILCLNIGWRHHELFPSLGHLWNEIHQTNSITQVLAYPSEQTEDSEVPLVCFHIHHILYQLQHLL